MLQPHDSVTISYRVWVPWTVRPAWLYSSAVATLDQELWQIGSYALPSYYTTYLPLVSLKN